MKVLKERALQRAIHVNLEIKKNSEWTMPKLIENVLSRKERVKEDRQKEIDQRNAAKDLRHQLAHRNVLSNMGAWFAKRLVTFTKKGKEKKKRRQEFEMKKEEVGTKMIPVFSIPQYAKNRKTKFRRVDLGRAFVLDKAVDRELRKYGKNKYVNLEDLEPLKATLEF